MKKTSVCIIREKVSNISVKIAYSGDGGGGGEDSRSTEWEICSRGREGGHSDTSQ